MPVNYLEHKVYSINYNELYKELMEIKIINNTELQSGYLNNWIGQLKQADKIEVEQFEDKKFRQMILQEDLEAPEKYMIEVIYKSGTINIFFKVSKILQQIKLSSNIDDRIRNIPLSCFIEPNSYIKWDLTILLNHIKSDPILLVPLTIGSKKYVVIDGNHRLTKWKMEKKKYIPCYLLDGQWLINNDMFCSDFSKLMYIFQNRIVEIYIRTHDGYFGKADLPWEK